MGTSPLRTASSTSVCLRTVVSCWVAGDCASHQACCAMVWVGRDNSKTKTTNLTTTTVKPGYGAVIHRKTTSGPHRGVKPADMSVCCTHAQSVTEAIVPAKSAFLHFPLVQKAKTNQAGKTGRGTTAPHCTTRDMGDGETGHTSKRKRPQHRTACSTQRSSPSEKSTPAVG